MTPVTTSYLVTAVVVTPAPSRPARDGQSLADKLQRLVLQSPGSAAQVEGLVDMLLETGGSR